MESHTDRKASKIYLGILEMAARESEDKVDSVLADILDKEEDIVFENIAEAVHAKEFSERSYRSHVSVPDLSIYDSFLLDEAGKSERRVV